MRPNDRIRFNDSVDDRPQRTMLDGLAKPVERLPLRPDKPDYDRAEESEFIQAIFCVSTDEITMADERRH